MTADELRAEIAERIQEYRAITVECKNLRAEVAVMLTQSETIGQSLERTLQNMQAWLTEHPEEADNADWWREGGETDSPDAR